MPDQEKLNSEAGKNNLASHLFKNSDAAIPKDAAPDPSLKDLSSLLEKNLKWSQIIYEQNRRLSRKFLYLNIWGWLKLILILIPIVLGIIYLPPVIRRYECILYGTNCPKNPSASLEQIIQLLPVNSNQKEQIKAILK